MQDNGFCKYKYEQQKRSEARKKQKTIDVGDKLA